MQLLEVLLDSDVMVDILREYPPALEWLDRLIESKVKVSLPGYVVMELIQGCENKQQVRDVQEEVEDFRIIWPSEESCDRALEVYARYHLSHGLSMLDALIGQMAEDLKMPLHTFNEKHFKRLFKVETVQPYQREYS